MIEKYAIIYADPPWTYKQSGSTKNSRGMAKQHYNTMKIEDICRLPVRNMAEDNAVLFMWATFPMMAEALKVIDSWGFIYKSAAFVWVKQNKVSLTPFWGMGAYTRANSEVCLIAISKNTKAKKQVLSHAVHQIIHAPVMKHSQKPAEVRDSIVKLLGDRKRIELFARQKTTGLDIWGNELENDIEL